MQSGDDQATYGGDGDINRDISAENNGLNTLRTAQNNLEQGLATRVGYGSSVLNKWRGPGAGQSLLAGLGSSNSGASPSTPPSRNYAVPAVAAFYPDVGPARVGGTVFTVIGTHLPILSAQNVRAERDGGYDFPNFMIQESRGKPALGMGNVDQWGNDSINPADWGIDILSRSSIEWQFALGAGLYASFPGPWEV